MMNPRGHIKVGTSGYALVCDFNALCALESHFGDFDAGMEKIMRGDLGLSDLRAVVAIMLRHDVPFITLRDAGDFIDQNREGIADCLRRAVVAALPDGDGEDGKKKSSTSGKGGGYSPRDYLISHIAAGFNPKDFWSLTPREWAIWMEGAIKRDDIRHRMAVQEVWIGHNYSHDELSKYLAEDAGPLDPEVLDRMLHHTSVGLTETDMGSYLEAKRMKGR